MSEKVFIYALSTCSHCKRTKQFLDEHQISYDHLDVDLTEGDDRTGAIEDVKKYNPRCTFPTVIIGDRVIVGFKEDELRAALGL